MSGSTADCPASSQASEPPPPSRTLQILTICCRYLLAAIFLMAALTKITDLNAFSDRLVLHSGLPYRLAVVVAATLPWLELTCGFCLALGLAVREAAVIISILLLGFLAESLIQPSEADCACWLFPKALEPANRWPWSVVRNGVLLICSTWLAWRKS